MNQAQPPQTNIEQPITSIRDEDLALEVAFGEEPHIEVAQEVMESGKFHEVAGSLATAEASGITVAKSYVKAEQPCVDDLREQIGTGIQPETVETETTFEAKVTATITAMAEHYKVKPEDFGLISFEREDGTKASTIMYTAVQGLDLGDPSKTYDQKRSYGAIMADDSHVLEIDGKAVDARTGSTEAAYKAFINQEIAMQTNPLPDSVKLTPWTLTLLTAEKAGSDDARCGRVGEAGAGVGWIFRGDGDRDVRFRPAVEI